MELGSPAQCSPLVEGEDGDSGCIYWKSFDQPPAASICQACPMTGMFCRDCKDNDICPKAGLPRFSAQITEWIREYFDYDSLKVALPGKFNRDIMAYRAVNREHNNIKNRKIDEAMKKATP